ncbi:MAG: FecR domain-containing protein [Lysobacterales bacterium]
MNTTEEKTATMEQAAQWMSRLGATDHPNWGDPDFTHWLDQSISHREAFAEVSALWFAAEQLPPPVATSHVDWEPLAAPTFRFGRWRLWAGAALGLMVLLVLPTLPQRWTAVQADYVTERGETATITLKDGSTIQLAGHSAVSRSDNGRGIELHYGEAFLTVTHDPQDPFVVATGDSAVTVLGTQFGVAWRNDEHRAGVVSGRIEVAVEHQQPIQLGPGQHALNGSLSPHPDRDHDYFSWRSGNLVFSDAPLSHVLDRIAPFLSQRVIRLPGTDDPKVTAVVNLNVGEQLLESLVQSADMQLLSAGPVTLLY